MSNDAMTTTLERPVENRVADTERALLDAALAEVTEHGIRRTTVADIARRSGLSRQTLYRYWPDAQALFAALVTRELMAVIPTTDVPERDLDAFVEALVDTADGVRGLPILDRLRDTDPELFARYVFERLGASQRGILVILTARIVAAQRLGYVRAGEPAQLAAMVLLVTQSAVQSAPLMSEWLEGRAWRDELGHCLRGYLAPSEPAGTR